MADGEYAPEQTNYIDLQYMVVVPRRRQPVAPEEIDRLMQHVRGLNLSIRLLQARR